MKLIISPETVRPGEMVVVGLPRTFAVAHLPPFPQYTVARVDDTLVVTRTACCTIDIGFSLSFIEQYSFKADFPQGSYKVQWVDRYIDSNQAFPQASGTLQIQSAIPIPALQLEGYAAIVAVILCVAFWWTTNIAFDRTRRRRSIS